MRPCPIEDRLLDDDHLIKDLKPSEEKRISKIKALRGKYKIQLTPSNEFAKRKREEILMER
ncbi:MAG: hypothetical protein HQK72_04870 [Desulfamplus sp.]|nr:hypothetical protein [Desulfamplus sp.]